MSRFDDLGKLRRVCDACGGELHHPPGRGRPRRYCDDDCAADARDERRRQEAAFDAAADLREVRAGVDALRLELRSMMHQGDALASASLAELEDEFGGGR